MNTLDRQFLEYFGVRDKFMDRMLTVLTKKYQLDIIKFDDWLAEFHGYDCETHGSMADFITLKFGEEACAFIRSLLGIGKNK